MVPIHKARPLRCILSSEINQETPWIPHFWTGTNWEIRLKGKDR
jgi:hypothetical protein